MREPKKSIYAGNREHLPLSETNYYLANDDTIRPWTGETSTSNAKMHPGENQDALDMETQPEDDMKNNRGFEVIKKVQENYDNGQKARISLNRKMVLITVFAIFALILLVV